MLGDHKFNWNVEIEPNCNSEGLMVNSCEYCDEINGKYVISKLEHNYKNGWVNIIESTCTQQGVAVRICANCGDLQSKELYLIPHMDSNGDHMCDYGCGYELPQFEKEKSFLEKVIEWFENLFNK